jgi:hypothetical protein
MAKSDRSAAIEAAADALATAADALATRLTWRDWGTKKVAQTIVKAMEDAGFVIRQRIAPNEKRPEHIDGSEAHDV